MTTIVYNHKDKQIAVDSRLVNHGLAKSDSFDKTIENEYGLWIFSGNASDMKDLCVLKHNDEASTIPNCTAFLISDGKCFEVQVNDSGICEHFEITFNEAKGSGSELALAAMDFGKSAKEAVEYAITRDIYSGGEVRVFDVKERE